MTYLEAVILGIIQGLTEFLPVSSSGHLILFQSIFGLENDNLLFDVVLHIGTLIPVLFVFREDIWGLIRRPVQKYVGLIILATIPAVAAALLFGDRIDSLFGSAKFLPFGFIVTGVVLLLADRVKGGNRRDADISYPNALLIGLAQAVAITPAISRSGSTIAAALGCKLDRKTAAKFSFVMSIPAILGAFVLQVKDLLSGGVSVSASELRVYALGFAAALLSGYLAIKFMLALIKKARLRYFSIYVFALAAFLLANNLFGWQLI